MIAGRTMENTEKDKDAKNKEKDKNTSAGEQLYLEEKSCSSGFSQWEALSPTKRARYQAEAEKITSILCNQHSR